ncbi:MAG: ATP synthase subunit I [Chlorobium sp.]|nr:ATP synthase subunit I [Chlorobium sp.]MCW8814468.1 ATP synthase subunit I [Chlorobium sp.]MCW8819541.1 ATP synthase subunit I [Ignavibacteriaceae bacterium]
MMNEFMAVAAFCVAGIVLGTFFFGGLWLTVEKSTTSTRPWLWFPLSMVLRTVVVLGGLYLIAGEGWMSLLSSLAGFTASRIMVIHCTRRPLKTNGREEVDCASER